MGNRTSSADRRKEAPSTTPPPSTSHPPAEHRGGSYGFTLSRRGLSFGCDGCGKSIAAEEPRFGCIQCGGNDQPCDFCADCGPAKHEELQGCRERMERVACSSVVVETQPFLAPSLRNRFHAYAERPFLGTLIRRQGPPKTGSPCVSEGDACADGTSINTPASPPASHAVAATSSDGAASLITSTMASSPAPTSETHRYVWTSYASVFRQADALARFLRERCDADNAQRWATDRPHVAVSGANAVPWYVCDYACMLGAMVSVPIVTTADEGVAAHIIRTAAVEAIVCSAAQAARLMRAVESSSPPSVHTIVVWPSTEGEGVTDATSLSGESGCTVFTLQDAIQRGQELADIPSDVLLTKDEPGTLIFTSGSTGLPKGVIVSTRTLHDHVSVAFGTIWKPLCTFSYGPLALASQRYSGLSVMGNGGRIAISSGHMSALFDEIAIARPTILSGPPRVWTSLHCRYQTELQLHSMLHPHKSRSEVESDVMTAFAATALGDRVRSISTGGAATPEHVFQWLSRCFPEAWVTESYGTTEAGSIAANGRIGADVDVRLEDVPELDYYGTDKPLPRGTLWVRTVHSAGGYKGNSEQTSASFDADGYVCTGDIVEFDPQERTIRIIDRAKNIFKLGQGCYVAPEKLENVFQQSALVDSIFVDGIAESVTVFAIIVPNMSLLRSRLSVEHPHVNWTQVSDEHVCAHDAVKSFIALDLVELGRQCELPAYEIPSDFVVEHVPWSADNGLLTPSLKKKRLALRGHYADQMRHMGAQLTSQQSSVVHDLSVRTYTKLIEDTLMMKRELGHDDVVDDDGDDVRRTPMTMNGVPQQQQQQVDSLSAVRLRSMLNQRLQLDVPLDDLIGLQDVEAFVQRMCSQLMDSDIADADGEDDGEGHQRQEHHRRHDTASAPVDWEQECELPDHLTRMIEQRDGVCPLWWTSHGNGATASSSPSSPSTDVPISWVLLTGATGFLGCHILAQLLLQRPHCRVLCPIRAHDDCAAQARLLSSLRLYGLLLPNDDDEGGDDDDNDGQRVTLACVRARVVGVPGDLTQPHFGWSMGEWDQRTSALCAVFHNGAWVNGLLNYTSLKASNVLGTLTCVEACLRACPWKRMDVDNESMLSSSSSSSLASSMCPIPGDPMVPLFHVSTLSVFGILSNPSEQRRIPAHVLPMLGGYGSSKAVAETLLMAAEALGFPLAAVWRYGTLSGNTVTGACNAGDLVTKLLIGVQQLGCAPNVDVHFDMIPVDHCATVFVCAAATRDLFGRRWHMTGRGLRWLDTAHWILTHRQQRLPPGTELTDVEALLIPFSEWRNRLRASMDNALHPLLSYFDVGFPATGTWRDDVSRATCARDLNLPHPTMTRELIIKYLEHESVMQHVQ